MTKYLSIRIRSVEGGRRFAIKSIRKRSWSGLGRGGMWYVFMVDAGV